MRQPRKRPRNKRDHERTHDSHDLEQRSADFWRRQFSIALQALAARENNKREEEEKSQRYSWLIAHARGTPSEIPGKWTWWLELPPLPPAETIERAIDAQRTLTPTP